MKPIVHRANLKRETLAFHLSQRRDCGWKQPQDLPPVNPKEGMIRAKDRHPSDYEAVQLIVQLTKKSTPPETICDPRVPYFSPSPLDIFLSALDISIERSTIHGTHWYAQNEKEHGVREHHHITNEILYQNQRSHQTVTVPVISGGRAEHAA
jgi:hypothetical protein